MDNTLNRKSKVLYFIKGMACLSVVIAHSLYPNTAGFLLDKFLHYADAAFFIIAGYFTVGATSEKIKNRILKLIKIFLFCLVLYTVVERVDRHYLSWAEFIYKFFSFKKIINAILLCDTPVCVAEWFILALIYTYATYLLFIKFNKTKLLLKLTPLLLIFGALFDVYSINYLSEIGHYFFLSRALPWFLVGMIIRNKYDSNDLNLSNIKLFIGVVIGYLIAISKRLIPINIDISSIGITIYAMCFFLFIFNNEQIFHNRLLEKIGKNYSLTMYICHPIITKLLIIILILNNIPFDGIAVIMVPASNVVISYLIAVITEKIKSKYAGYKLMKNV